MDHPFWTKLIFLVTTSVEDVQEEGIEERVAMKEDVVEGMEDFFIEPVHLNLKGCFIYDTHCGCDMNDGMVVRFK